MNRTKIIYCIFYLMKDERTSGHSSIVEDGENGILVFLAA